MQLTLFQRVMIQRLRERGLQDVAATARLLWSEGHRLETPVELLDGGPLLRDFERANEQVAARFDTHA